MDRKKPTSHRTPQATPINLHEVQISETQRCTSSSLQISKREER